ncbi:hypothetical protein [Treponema succinifaciens]|uniref:hypothetical protein n=1 Tax=Treponema succinifaciens TaxID=167 RepID=UPI0023EFF322|nr:hypothetical protein [Treponema succinifaciens]
MVGTTVALIGLGITSAASIGVNIFQGIKNKNLRKQIEQLKAIIVTQQNDIEELKKQMKALKLWAFKQRYEYSKEIKSLKQNLISNKQRLVCLENQVA